MALEKQGKDASIAVIRYGGHVLPIVDDEASERIADDDRLRATAAQSLAKRRMP